MGLLLGIGQFGISLSSLSMGSDCVTKHIHLIVLLANSASQLAELNQRTNQQA